MSPLPKSLLGFILKPRFKVVFGLGFFSSLLHLLLTCFLIPLSQRFEPLLTHFVLSEAAQLLGCIVGVYALKGVVYFGQFYCFSKVALLKRQELRGLIYAQYLESSLSPHQTLGEFLTHMVDDLEKIKQSFFHIWVMGLPNLILIGVLLCFLFYLNWFLMGMCLLLIPLISGIIQWYHQKIQDSAAYLQSTQAHIQQELTQGFSNTLTVRIFQLFAYQQSRFENVQNQVLAADLGHLKLKASQGPVLGLFQVIGIAATLLLAGHQVSQGTLTVGELLAFATALALTIDPILQLTEALQGYQVGLASWHRLDRFVLECQRTRHFLPEEADKGEIELENITFSHEQTLLFEGLSFQLSAGMRCRIVGESGLGKSTLLSLLAGILPPDKGQVRVSPHTFLVSQKTELFQGTLYENIVLGKFLSQVQFKAVLAVCQLTDLVAQWPQKELTELGAEGWRLSGGERQRVALARALAQEPFVLLLDEATSALDEKTEDLILNALFEGFPDMTCVFVSHRESGLKYIQTTYDMTHFLP